MSQVNKYNLFRWDDGGSPDEICSQYAIPVTDGDAIGCYVNFDDPITDDGSDWEVGIWIPSSIVVRNIATLNSVEVITDTYDLYFEYTVGVLPRWFRFVIYDPTDSDAIKYWSNGLKYKSVAGNTMTIKYRNNYNQVNINYEQIPDFYIQARIDAILGEPRPITDTVGYITSLGLPVTSKNIFSLQWKLVTLMMDAGAHLAMAKAVKSDEFYLGGTRYYTKQEDIYDSGATDQNYQRWNGNCLIYEHDYTVVATNT